MIAFAALVDAVAFAQGEPTKARILADYLVQTPDPARGLALAVLTGAAAFPSIKPAMLRALAVQRLDPVLYDLSRDFVGDALETIALSWPAAPTNAAAPALRAVVDALTATAKDDLPALIAGWLDAADATTRVVLLKLLTGAGDLGISPPVLMAALHALGRGRIDRAEIAAAWHTQAPPYEKFLAWIDGRDGRPAPTRLLHFRPTKRPQKITSPTTLPHELHDMVAEWRWDGLLVQLVAHPTGARLFSAQGADISAAFPDILQAMRFHAVLDGVLLTGSATEAGPFAAPHPRLGRKTVGPSLTAAHGLTVRLFDLLKDADEDLGALPFDARRERLQAWFDRLRPAGMAVSPLLPPAAWDLAFPMPPGTNGLVFKHRWGNASWQMMRPAPSRVGVLMYAERNAVRSGGPFANYTVGLRRDDGTLMPVGRADATLLDPGARATLDAWVSTQTTERFGPVRAVAIGLVLEIKFDAVRLSSRHKSGLVLENLRITAVWPGQDVASVDLLASL
ncbi:MAG: ATP-dependent DNA ligase [Acetobacteraceae bacterium]|nr:ATP-dependent DNA ligase [Acetobacteraceae bacterium]